MNASFPSCLRPGRPCVRRLAGRWVVVVALLSGAVASAQVSRGPRGDLPADLFQLDLEALMEVRITGAAGLTSTEARRRPVAMTQLGEREIQDSGAIDLNRLVEMFVPNAQFIDHHHLQPHLGFRGIISDREDKYLLQVNGRTMNNWTLLGADNERALPLLGDLRTVNVVRGPASATHGPGALIGVIDLETYSGLTFNGSDVTLRHGTVYGYSALEVRHGRRLSPTSGVFVYYGLADMRGADSDYYLGRSFPAANGLPAHQAGQPFAGPKARLGEAGYGKLWQKAHLSYRSGPFEVWARFVQDGGQNRPMREVYLLPRPDDVPLEEWVRGRQFQNRQATFDARFERDLNDAWSLEAGYGFDVWTFQDQRAGVYRLPVRHGRETEHTARAVATWRPAPAHVLAFGGDYSRVAFHNPPYSDTLDRPPAIADRAWDVDMLSFMAEHQWNPSKRWTTHLSLRSGRHTFTRWKSSPRATLVHAPTDRDTFKLTVGQSSRRGGDEELWSENVRNGTIPKPETLRSAEFSYHRHVSGRWSLGGTVFAQHYDAIGWIPSAYYSSSIGEYEMGGFELEASRRSGRNLLSASLGWTRLLDSSLPPGSPPAGQTVTAQPYGFGDDLAEWAPAVAKLVAVRELTRAWTANASVVWYSGFPGARDYADYAATLSNPPSAVPLSDPGYDEPYGPNLFVNLGLEYRPSPRWTLRIDGHNLAALADKTLSKRNAYFRLSEFSVQPATLALTVRYRH